MPKTIFIICSVRDADDNYREKLEKYTAYLEKCGHTVHLPHRNTNQTQSGLNICLENMNAIIQADEVHVFYTPDSKGTHFDLGMAFMLQKRLVVIESPDPDSIPGRSFARMIQEWEEMGHNSTPYNLPRGFILESEDWVGLYVDGECVHQDHDFNDNGMDLAMHLEKVGVRRSEIFKTFIGSNDNEQAMSIGYFPDNFDDLLDKDEYINEYLETIK